jgi:MoaA/NifB/PqqE/SkfB family radical SAM enzyme
VTPKEYLTNKSFCPMPWTGLMYNFDGTIKTCIRSAEPIGNIKDSPVEEILHNSKNVDTRAKMLSNQPGDRCYPCYELEKETNSFDIISDRVFYLKELKSIPLTTYTQPTTFNLHTVDVRWSNLCNFSCVYCGPEFSSKWAAELNINIKTPEDTRLEEFKNYVFNHAAQLKHVYLAGGEPLLMKENLEFLELLKEKNPDVKLRINTNLSKVDTRIFDLICTFKNVHWIISLETIEEEYEYIRHGGKWEDFLDNLKTLQKLDHVISFNMLHFALNSMSLFDCIDFLNNLGFHNNSFIVGALLQPLNLNIRQLPDDMLKLVKDELVSRINKQPGFLLENGYRNALAYINQPFKKDTSQLFKFLKKIDNSRNLDSKNIFNDLYKFQ